MIKRGVYTPSYILLRFFQSIYALVKHRISRCFSTLAASYDALEILFALLSLQIGQLLKQAIRDGDDTAVCLESTLGGDHLGEL